MNQFEVTTIEAKEKSIVGTNYSGFNGEFINIENDFALPERGGINFSFSRLYLYVHFPTDVLAGILLGTLNGWLSLILYRKYKGENQLT